MNALDDIRRACQRLRRLPEARWSRPPSLPAGARAAMALPSTDGPPLEQLVRSSCARLMQADARSRGVRQFNSDVSVFGLADELQALSRSVMENPDEQGRRVLEQIAREAQTWC